MTYKKLLSLSRKFFVLRSLSRLISILFFSSHMFHYSIHIWSYYPWWLHFVPSEDERIRNRNRVAFQMAYQIGWIRLALTGSWLLNPEMPELIRACMYAVCTHLRNNLQMVTYEFFSSEDGIFFLRTRDYVCAIKSGPKSIIGLSIMCLLRQTTNYSFNILGCLLQCSKPKRLRRKFFLICSNKIEFFYFLPEFLTCQWKLLLETIDR